MACQAASNVRTCGPAAVRRRGFSQACKQQPSRQLQQRQQRRSSRRAACQSAAPSCSTVVTVPTTDGGAAASPSPADGWANFAENVSGEWEGVTASFGPDGEPIPLPEYYVPQAYRDWCVEIFDWQSQSSMLADAEGLTATNRRMMPTVGCEADAIAYTQAACKLFQSSTDTGAATVAPDGSYSQGPHDISAADCTKAALEQCLVVEPRRRRLRVVHNLRRTGGEGRWVLDSVEVHNERYDSPYRGKVELSGCGGGMKAFAGDQRLAAEAVQGSWEASGVRYSVDGDASGQCSREAVSGEGWSAEDVVATGLLLHPLQAWSACDIRGEDVTVTAGVLLDEGGSSMAVATRRLVAGRLVAAELLTLTRKAA